MEQRLRLVQGGGRYEKRTADRHHVAVPGQIVWKDARGTTRMAVGRHARRQRARRQRRLPGRHAHSAVPPGLLPGGPRRAQPRRTCPPSLRKSSVLSAIFRVGPCSDVTGVPTEYALRLLVEPERRAAHVE